MRQQKISLTRFFFLFSFSCNKMMLCNAFACSFSWMRLNMMMFLLLQNTAQVIHTTWSRLQIAQMIFLEKFFFTYFYRMSPKMIQKKNEHKNVQVHWRKMFTRRRWRKRDLFTNDLACNFRVRNIKNLNKHRGRSKSITHHWTCKKCSCNWTEKINEATTNMRRIRVESVRCKKWSSDCGRVGLSETSNSQLNPLICKKFLLHFNNFKQFWSWRKSFFNPIHPQPPLYIHLH